MRRLRRLRTTRAPTRESAPLTPPTPTPPPPHPPSSQLQKPSQPPPKPCPQQRSNYPLKPPQSHFSRSLRRTRSPPLRMRSHRGHSGASSPPPRHRHRRPPRRPPSPPASAFADGASPHLQAPAASPERRTTNEGGHARRQVVCSMRSTGKRPTSGRSCSPPPR